jgi:iron complex transport system permease protein
MKYIILIVLCVLSLSIGAFNIDWFNYNDLDIFLISRVPRLLSILMVGSGMAISGLIIQSITRNKFSSPSTVGTIECAAMGILFTMVIMPDTNVLYKMIISLIFSIIGTIIFLKLVDEIKSKDILFVPLLGLMFGKVVTAVTLFFAYKYDLDQSLTSYLIGDFSVVLQGRYELLYIGIPLVILAFIYGTRFTIISLGKDFTHNLGVNYDIVKYIGITIVGCISAVTVVTVGMIPYIGLVVPNIVSRLYGDNIKKNIVTIGVYGVILVLVADILGRIIIYPFEIPVGTILGVIGSLGFLVFILKEK